MLIYTNLKERLSRQIFSLPIFSASSRDVKIRPI